METVDVGADVFWHYQACQRGGRKRRAKVVKPSASGARVLVEWQDNGFRRVSWVALENLSAVAA